MGLSPVMRKCGGDCSSGGYWATRSSAGPVTPLGGGCAHSLSFPGLGWEGQLPHP